nr:type I polyketide synthase [Millisia brevis]
MGGAPAIAVIGAAGRFPGARSVSEFWLNIQNGCNSAVELTDEMLMAEGFTADEIASGAVVRRRFLLADVDRFDSNLFGYAASEADIVDPQQRIALETVWELFESAGYDPTRFDGAIGSFAASGFNSYLLANVARNPQVIRDVGLLSVSLGNTKDFLTTRLAYHFDLRGPAVTVGTGCSSGLVAVHLAAQSLLAGESDLAVAGGVTVSFPQTGYRYRPGGTNSADGFCRAFDRRAGGAVPGDASAFVLLKRLDDAVADRDEILGVLLGTAINNDGADKLSFTAPSLDGQAAVIAEAVAIADIRPDDIHYIEAHGTGTPLGDAVEVQALTEAFESTGTDGHWLGSVKTAIGHTDTAAGVVGLINILGAYRHDRIPPTLHFEEPNPTADFATCGFRVAAEPIAWPRPGTRRLAAVSSFGIGGTNAHAIVADPPDDRPEQAMSVSSPRWQLARLSAADPVALAEGRSALVDWLHARGDVDIARVCHTLAVGRRELRYRSVVVGRTAADIADALDEAATVDSRDGGAVGFLFPGQGAQYPLMGAGLYREEPVFRRAVDGCLELLGDRFGIDLRAVFDDPTRATDLLSDTRFIQPALFVVEYATTELLAEWGVRPAAVVGHSLGELVAATVAGSMTWQTGCALSAIRGRLMAQPPPGATVAIACDVRTAEELIARAGATDIAIAAANADDQTVVSGGVASIEALVDDLRMRRVRATRLPGTVAVHSPLMDDVVDEFRRSVSGFAFRSPAAALVSGASGDWLDPSAVPDGDYWARQIRVPVRYREAFDAIESRCPVLIEIGPSNTLQGIAARRGFGRRVVTTLGPADASGGDASRMARAVGRLWARGVRVDRPEWIDGPPPRRISLPTYCFQGRRHWVTPADTAQPAVVSREARPGPAESTGDDGRGDADGGRRFRSPAHRVVVDAWQHVLGITDVPSDAEFQDLGGHSLLAVNLRAFIERSGIEISIGELMAEPTVSGMTRAVEAVERSSTPGRKPPPATATAEMLADVRRLADTVGSGAPTAAVDAVERVLLTGATGFVGAFVLAELLDRGVHRVICPVRADSDADAADRIERVMSQYRLRDPRWADRIDAVAGDIELPGFGLTDRRFAGLTEVDLIVHNAARVDVTASYRRLSAMNVTGTRHVFDLATTGRAIPVLHMSTSGAVVRGDERGLPIVESRRLAAEDVLALGYPQSKWVAEQIALRARERGLPVAVVRPHRISPHSVSGRGAYDDAMWNIVTACLELGVIPRADSPGSTATPINFVPVDYVASAVAHLGIALATDRLPDPAGADFHLANPTETTLDAVFSTARELGYECAGIPWEDWVTALTDSAVQPGASTATRAAATIVGAGARSPEMGSIRLDCTRARSVLDGNAIVCPPIDSHVVGRYLRQLMAPSSGRGTHDPAAAR